MSRTPNIHAAKLGEKGGQKTLKKYGKDHMRKLAKKGGQAFKEKMAKEAGDKGVDKADRSA